MNILLPNVLLFFAPISALIYQLTSSKFGRIHGLRILNLCSLVFLACLPLIDILLLLASISINYAVIRFRIAKKGYQLFGAIFINIAIIFVFRYLPSYASTLKLLGKEISLDWAIPIGISYFTFLQIACLVDCYRGQIKNIRLSEYLAYITFFPKYISGPIVRYNQFCSELNASSNFDTYLQGWLLVGIGVFKKFYFANYFSSIADAGYGYESYSMYSAWLVSITYTFQIYFDFSAYTDIARGLAKLFGINLPYNFNSPYKSCSVQDFWRRWHISLSYWLRDYIYIPLGGSRVPKIRVYTNIILTFLICGIWHGPTLTYVVWGLYHGCGLAIQRLFGKLKFSIPKLLTIGLTFLFVHIGWIIFRSKSLSQALEVISGLMQVSNRNLNHDLEIKLQLIYRLILAAFIIFLAPNSHVISKIYQFASINIRSYLEKLGRRLFIYSIISYCSLLVFGFLYYNSHFESSFYELFPLLTKTEVSNKHGDYRNNLAAQKILYEPGRKVLICGSSFCKNMGFYSWFNNGDRYISGSIATGGNSLATGLRQAFYVLENYKVDTLILGVSPLNFHKMKKPRGPFKDQGSELINMAIGKKIWPEFALYRLIPYKWNFYPVYLLLKDPMHSALFQLKGFLFNISQPYKPSKEDGFVQIRLDELILKNVDASIIEQISKAKSPVKNQENGDNKKFKWESRGILESLMDNGDAYKMFRQLKRICDIKHVHLVIYDTPTAPHKSAPSIYPKGFLQNYSDTISKAMNQLNIEYYDLSGLFPFKREFFIDFIHLQTSQRKLLHEYLLSRIFNNRKSEENGK